MDSDRALAASLPPPRGEARSLSTGGGLPAGACCIEAEVWGFPPMSIGSARDIRSILMPLRLNPRALVYGSCRMNCSSHAWSCTCPHRTGAGVLTNAGVRSTHLGTKPRLTSSTIPRCTSDGVSFGGGAPGSFRVDAGSIVPGIVVLCFNRFPRTFWAALGFSGAGAVTPNRSSMNLRASNDDGFNNISICFLAARSSLTVTR
mmetsp:Transcript_87414/g.232914  ORF Transcript_87414/g.232914 Transcript_87414/m.232914 type:complete len:203 (+) Transcript_87414:1053-1661(+)